MVVWTRISQDFWKFNEIERLRRKIFGWCTRINANVASGKLGYATGETQWMFD